MAVFDDEKERCIGAALSISPHTVHSYLERIYLKLGVASRCALVVRVLAAYLALAGVTLRSHAGPPGRL